jgi:GLPGLI family protein
MKKILFTISLLSLFITTNAQKDFQGMAVYESKTSTADFKKRFEGNKDITPEMAKMIEDRMKRMSEKTFILNFDKNASIYKEEEKLDAPGTQGGGMRMMASMTGGGGTFYKNVKEKNYLVDKDFMGKEFLVKDSLQTIKWKMEGETREIGGYMCMKATAVRPASKSDFRNFRPKEEKKEEKKEDKKEGDKVEAKPKSTNFMSDVELPKEINITAWYTPEIPVNQGPEGYWGLPGLILEVNDGKTTIVCSKVVMNIKEKAEIKAPTKGKEISQKDYDEVVTAKMKEMMEMNQGRGGNGGMQIRMGR